MNYELLSDHKLKSDIAFTTKLSELENIISQYKEHVDTQTITLQELIKENYLLKLQIEELSERDNVIAQLHQEIDNKRNKINSLVQELYL